MKNLNIVSKHTLSNNIPDNQFEEIPKTFKAIMKNDSFGDEVSVVNINMPDEIDPDEVIIKIYSAVISPYDRLFMINMQGYKKLQKKPPCGLGFEGSGKIVKVGSNISKTYLGKKCMFINDAHDLNFMGSWAEYIVRKGAWLCVDEKVKQENIALGLSNPLTAMEFINIAKFNKSSCIVQTAAAGTLGIMLIKLAKENNIDVINIVTGEADKKVLKDLNVDQLLNTKSSYYNENLRKLIKDKQPTCLFDAVGGNHLSDLLVFMPPKSSIVLYGWLSQEPTVFSNGLLIMHEKNIMYYWAKKFLDILKTSKRWDEQGMLELEGIKDLLIKIKEDQNSGGKIFGYKIACEGGINDFKQLIESSESFASQGKTIFKFHEIITYKKLF